MNGIKSKPANPFKDDSDDLQIIFIDPKKDVFKGQFVVGPADIEVYKKKLVKDLVESAIKNITPEIEEKNGYEIVKYELIIKQHRTKTDGSAVDTNI